MVLNMPPSPSPSHQTPSDHAIVPARAARAVARHSSPAASASWTVANIAFHGTTWPEISRSAISTGPDTNAGSPIPDGASIMTGNVLVNMDG